MANYFKTPILLVLVFLANATDVFGQNIFQKRSDLNYWYDEFTSVFSSDTGFLAIGAGIPLVQIDSNTTIEGGGKSTFTWYDWNGNIVKQKGYLKIVLHTTPCGTEQILSLQIAFITLED
ncbi:MAG: hypothetical protein M0D57_15555 [Sphingobacteriales bacterium JAD_PAG50586_3]|nr:MAG: hypothetical protein M0D57_15555 [Sphingobacteriales bacterium JAD_PAG50586_3]